MLKEPLDPKIWTEQVLTAETQDEGALRALADKLGLTVYVSNSEYSLNKGQLRASTIYEGAPSIQGVDVILLGPIPAEDKQAKLKEEQSKLKARIDEIEKELNGC